MKSHEPESWIDVRRMPPGRRQWALLRVQERLPADETALRERCAEGISAETALHALLLKFKGDREVAEAARVWPQAVVELDARLDRQIGGLRTLFDTLALVLADKPAGAAWQRLAARAFPAGAAYYTAQPYIEQAARVGALLAEVGKPEWAALTAEPVLRDALAELTATQTQYAREVAKFEQVERVAWDAVKAADLANHRRLCQLIAAIVARFEGDAAARERLLAPIAQQDQEVYEALRAQRRVLDVDPTTGEAIAPVPPPSVPVGPATPTT